MPELSPIEKFDQDMAAHSGRQSGLLAHASGLAATIIAIVLCTAITYFSHFTFGFFKIIFGVFAGIMVKHIGRGSGSRFGNIAGFYAVLAVVGYEIILSTFFIASNDPSMLSESHDAGQREFLKSAHNLSKIIMEIATAIFAYILAYRIGKNPMKKDELDYLLEAKFPDQSEEKYSKNRFQKRRRG